MTPLYTLHQSVQIHTTKAIGTITKIFRAGPFWPTTYLVAIPGRTPELLYHEPELAPVKGAVHAANPRSLPAGRVVDLSRARRRDLIPRAVAPDAPEAA